MLELTLQQIEAYLGAMRYEEHRSAGQLGILCLRGCTHTASNAIQPAANQPDAFNDCIIVFGRDSAGEPMIRVSQGSVDPGLHYTMRPLNAKGCAHIINGQYKYQRGRHRGRLALTQYGPVQVWRDFDKDFARDPHELVERGFFGINIHAGGSGPRIGPNSAGCITVRGSWNTTAWQEFRTLAYSHDGEFIYVTVDDYANFSRLGTEQPPRPFPVAPEMLERIVNAQRELYAIVPELLLDEMQQRRALAGLNEFNRVMLEAGIKKA